MTFLRLTIVVVAAMITAMAVGAAASHRGHHHHDYYAKPKYHFKYGVDDPKHGDHHSQWEERDGDKVKGGYSLKEADGTWRHVTYTSDKESGFNAVVERRGHAVHPHGHHGHLKADLTSAVKDFATAKAEATHDSLEHYPDGAYGYIR